MTGTIKKQERKTFRQSIEGIVSSVRIDTYDDDYQLPRHYYYENGRLTLLSANGKERNEAIKIEGKIKATGYIFIDIDENILVNYICGKKYCGYNTDEDSTIKIKNNDGSQIPEIDLEAPMITLVGEEKVILGIGERYVEKGVIAETRSGEDLRELVVTKITKEGKTVSQVDTSRVEKFLITYSVTYQGKTVTTTRQVEVRDERPVITITKADSKYVKKKEVVIEVKPTTGNTVHNFVYQINDGREKTVNGIKTTIKLEETGEYQIKVEATDSKGHKRTQEEGMYKIDTVPPTITIAGNVSLRADEVTGFDFYTGVTTSDNVSEVTVNVEGNIESIPGEYTLTYIARDEAGNEATKTRTITVLETQAPIINLSSNGTDGYTQGLSVTMTATDNNGVKSFHYQVESNGVLGEVIPITDNNFSKEIRFNQTGIYKIHLVATDIYDNTSTLISREYKVDTEIPQIVYKVGGNIVEGTIINSDTSYAGYFMGCFNGAQTIEAIPSDTGGSGVDRIESLMQKPDSSWLSQNMYHGESISYTADTEGYWGLHTQAWDNAGNNKIGISTADHWLRHLIYIDTSAGTLNVNTNGYTPGTVVGNDVTFTLTGSNTGCETTKHYYYSVNNGDWVYMGTGDSINYSSSSFTTNMVTKDYNVKFLITDGWGRWGQMTDNYYVKVYKDIYITFDSPNDLSYFNMDDYLTGGSITVSNGYAVQSTTRSDAYKTMQLLPTHFGRTDFSYMEWRVRVEAGSSYNQFPFISILFTNGIEFRYYLMNNVTSTSGWGYQNLSAHTGNAMWQYSDTSVFDYYTTPTVSKFGIMGPTERYQEDTTYSISHNPQTGTLTIYDGHLNKTITTESLTTNPIYFVNFNFLSGGWSNRNNTVYLDYVKVR